MKVDRCGSCHFGKALVQDVTKRICHGWPPSASQVPAGPGRMTIQSSRPIVNITDEACSLYREKNQHDQARDVQDMQEFARLKHQVETKQ